LTGRVEAMGIKDYKRFLLYCPVAFGVSVLLSYIRCRWPWPRLLSFGWALDIFWLFVIAYFEFDEKGVRKKWDENVKPIMHLSFRPALAIFAIFDLLFIFPEYVVSPLATQSPLMYLRTLVFVSLFIGSASVMSFSLGWATSIHATGAERGDIVRVLSNLITAISFFGIILSIFSHFAPSESWVSRLPQSFSNEDLMGLFGQFSSTLLYFTSIFVGIGSIVTGILMNIVSKNDQELFFFLGSLFCLVIGLIVGYAIGPLVFFAVTEVAFAGGSMIALGLITCMLAKDGRSKRS
jgi:hypothetical protein